MSDLHHPDSVTYELELSEAQIMRMKQLMQLGCEKIVQSQEDGSDEAAREAIELKDDFMEQYRTEKYSQFEWFQ